MQPFIAADWVVVAGGLLVTTLLALASVALAREWVRLEAVRSFRRQSAELFAEELAFARARRTDREGQAESWSGYRKFRVERKVQEAPGVVSLHLAPHDRKPLPSFAPGQFVTLQLRLAGQTRPIVRCYSLSDVPSADRYRVTVKRAEPPAAAPDAPAGRASSFVCEQVSEGDLLDMRAPSGNFRVDLMRHSPLVLIAGGVGVTPLAAMLRAVAERGFDREVWLFYGEREPSGLLWREELERLAAEHPDRLRVVACLSRVNEADLPTSGPGILYRTGRVTVDALRALLPSNNFTFYVCGPPAMLEQVTHDLGRWGVPPERIRFEAFGAASVRSVAPAAAEEKRFAVTFERSGKRVSWSSADGSLLDLAAREGVFIDSNCRAGNCGTCCVAVKAGEFRYAHAPGEAPPAGTCLSCVARPSSDLVLDA